MFSIRCADDKVYKECPRCHDYWEVMAADPSIFRCKNDECGMLAVSQKDPNDNNKYYLLFDIDTDTAVYSIAWEDDYCTVNAHYLESEKFVESILPILPFSITIEKLKTYLIFS